MCQRGFRDNWQTGKPHRFPFLAEVADSADRGGAGMARAGELVPSLALLAEAPGRHGRAAL